MKKKMFGDLRRSMEEALEHARGQRNLRTTTLPLPPPPLHGTSVREVRARVGASQAVFARYLNVSTKLVQAWEADRRVPEGPALVLLHIAREQPGLLEAIRDQARPARRGITKATGRVRTRRTTTAERRPARSRRAPR